MVDKDEDTIHTAHPSTAHDSDEDSSDELAKDFRLLNLNTTGAKHATSHPPSDPRHSGSASALPKRGLKDFEPHPTLKQADQLAASRDAMQSALEYERAHAPKTHVVGVYDSASGRVVVRAPRGVIFQTVGRSLSGGKGEKGVGGGSAQGGVELLPEEALWLLERGSLDVHWSLTDFVDEEDIQEVHEEEEDTLPMSLQAAYATLLGEEYERGGWLTAEKYQVYSYLKRTGYIVMRADPTPNQSQSASSHHNLDSSLSNENKTIFTHLYDLLIRPLTQGTPETEAARLLRQRHGPLATPGLYRSYNDIYRLLRLVPSHSPAASPQVQNTQYTTHYNVYNHSSTTPFRKTAPPPPTFRICVVSARETALPTLAELSGLLGEQALDTTHRTRPNEGTVNHMYSRLKKGRRNVIIATVDQGMMNFMKIGEAEFGEEELFKRGTGGRGGKRGGFGGGRGGGRGRGRGGGAGSTERGGRG